LTADEPNLRKNVVLTTGIKPLGVRAMLDAIQVSEEGLM
jgi:hypothetical protein